MRYQGHGPQTVRVGVFIGVTTSQPVHVGCGYPPKRCVYLSHDPQTVRVGVFMGVTTCRISWMGKTAQQDGDQMVVCISGSIPLKRCMLVWISSQTVYLSGRDLPNGACWCVYRGHDLQDVLDGEDGPARRRPDVLLEDHLGDVRRALLRRLLAPLRFDRVRHTD